MSFISSTIAYASGFLGVPEDVAVSLGIVPPRPKPDVVERVLGHRPRTPGDVLWKAATVWGSRGYTKARMEAAMRPYMDRLPWQVRDFVKAAIDGTESAVMDDLASVKDATHRRRECHALAAALTDSRNGYEAPMPASKRNPYDRIIRLEMERRAKRPDEGGWGHAPARQSGYDPFA